MAKERLSVQIDARENVSREARKAGDSIDNLGRRGRSAFEGIGSAIVVANQGLDLFQRALSAVGRVTDLAKIGAEAAQVRQSFENMASDVGASSAAVIRDLRQFSGGTISELDAMSSATRAMLFELPVDRLDELMQIARASATATGASVQQMFDDIVTGISRASPMILDNLGITVKLGEANQSYAESLGKTVEDLTSAEQKQALLNAVLQSGEGIMNRMGDAATEITDLEKYQQLDAQWNDFKANLGGVLNEALAPLTEGLAEALSYFNAMSEGARNFASAMRTFVATDSVQSLQSAIVAMEQMQQSIVGMQGMIAPDSFFGTLADIFTIQANSARGVLDYFNEQMENRLEILEELLEERGGLPDAPTTPSPTGGRSGGASAGGGSGEPTRDEILGAQTRYMKRIRMRWFRAFEELNRSAADRWGEMDFAEVLKPIMAAAGGKFRESAGDGPAGETDSERRQRLLDTHGLEGLAARIGFVSAGTAEAGLPMPGDFSHETPTEFDNLMSGMMDSFSELDNFGVILQVVTGQMGLLTAALQPVIEGFMSVIGPAIEGILEPLFDTLFHLGQTVGELLLPLFSSLSPVIELIVDVLISGLAPALSLLAAVVSIINPILMLLQPLLTAIAIAFEILSAPIKFVADLFEHLAKSIEYFFRLLDANPANDNMADPGAFSSDAFSGLQGRIDAIIANSTPGQGVEAPSYGDTLDDWNGGGSPVAPGAGDGPTIHGGSTTISQPPDINVYQTFNGPILGADGMREFGELTVEAIQAYVGAGGQVAFA